MSTGAAVGVTERLVGASLQALGKGAGEEAVKEICSVFMGDIFGGGDSGNAEVDAEILAKLDKVLSGLDEVKDSLQQIEQVVARVDADIDAAAILHEVSSITSLHDKYFSSLRKLAEWSKSPDPASKQGSASCRKRIVELSKDVKNQIPQSLQIIHDFVAGQGNYLGRLAKANILQTRDIFQFYGQTKLPLIKIATVEHKAIHLLRLAVANPDPHVNFPDGPDAIDRALSNIDIQEESLRSSIGPKSHDLVSTILTEYPKPVPTCVNLYETRGLNYDGQAENKWFGSNYLQLWHIEPASNDSIVTDGSKANGFRLKHWVSGKYMSISPVKLIMGMVQYNLLGTDSRADAAVWNLQLTPDWKFLLQPQAYPDVFCCRSLNTSGPNNRPRHNLALLRWGNRAKDTQSFTVNIYRGPINNFWPGNMTSMNDGDRLYPGAYLESPNKNFRLTFENDKFGVWDVQKKSWKWDSGVSVIPILAPSVQFLDSGSLRMDQRAELLGTWGSFDNQPNARGYVLKVNDSGIAQIVRPDNGHCKWSSEMK